MWDCNATDWTVFERSMPDRSRLDAVVQAKRVSSYGGP